MWNTFNSIHWIWTYINTNFILFPTCLLIYHSCTFIGYLRSLDILISSDAWLTITRFAGSTLAGLITCSAISFPVAAFISTKNSFTLCPSFNLKALERELLYEIRQFRGSFIICPSAYNPICSSSNSSCVKLDLNNAVRQYGSFGSQFFSMKSISSSQCLTSVYEACSCMLDVWSLLPFGTRQITTMKVAFGNSERLLLECLPVRPPESVAARLFPGLPSSLAFRTTHAHFFKYTSTDCRQIDSAWSNIFKRAQVTKVSKQSATSVSQSRGPSRSCFKQFCPRIMDLCFFSRYPATHTFFPWLKSLKLGCCMLLANCFKENSVCFKLIGAMPSAPPRSDESLH